ncbi:MAG: hypothetical protein WCK67_08430 [bacterium]
MNYKKEENKFEFDIEDALDIVLENISESLKSKFTRELVKIVLELEQVYLEELGIILPEGAPEPICNYPINVDWDELKYQIAFRAVKDDIFITEEELDQILDAETLYLQINGQISDMDDLLN